MIAQPWQQPILSRIALLACLILTGCPRAPEAPATADSYLFCFWNVENLFDDQDQPRGKSDDGYDNWFAGDPEMLHKKLHHLAAALVKLNGGRGPDILALAEVESPRAAELLRDELNRLLADELLHYHHVAMKEVKVGRHIAPALISRLPIAAERTRLHGKNMRILETHLQARDQELVVVASHWTSRVSDKNGRKRAHYADQIYGEYQAMYQANPQVDWLMAGDCNDPPDAPSIRDHLHASGNRAEIFPTAAYPRLFNLMADKPAKTYGTLYHRGWRIYDSIFVSPGLLDEAGWSCEPESIHTVNSLFRPGDRSRKPWRFGAAKDTGDRGASDHFPVTVRLRVQRR